MAALCWPETGMINMDKQGRLTKGSEWVTGNSYAWKKAARGRSCSLGICVEVDHMAGCVRFETGNAERIRCFNWRGRFVHIPNSTGVTDVTSNVRPASLRNPTGVTGVTSNVRPSDSVLDDGRTVVTSDDARRRASPPKGGSTSLRPSRCANGRGIKGLPRSVMHTCR